MTNNNSSTFSRNSYKKRKFKIDYECIVIGGGPGGLISSVYLGRYRRKVLLIDAGKSRARWIPRIRNLIGYARGLSGVELLRRLNKQVQLYKVDRLKGEAVVRRERGGFKIEVGPQVFRSRFVILAVGIDDVQPHVPRIEQLRRAHKLGYCPICDGYDHSHEKIALFIRDTHCFKKVKFISELCPDLTLVPVRDFVFSHQLETLLRERGIKKTKRPLEKLTLNGKSGRLRVHLKNLKMPMEFDFAYVAMGVHFNRKTTQHLKGLRRVREGFIETDSHQETSIPGLFAVGDCVNSLAQVSVAIGQAALAATRIYQRLVFKDSASHFSPVSPIAASSASLAVKKSKQISNHPKAALATKALQS